jgi:Fe-S oxidoreductase
MRRVSGYNLDLLLERDSLNLAKLLVGSEGTLAAVTEAKLNLVPIPPCRAVLVLHYSDLLESIDSVKHILKYDPTAVEVLDSYGLHLARENPAVAYLYKQFIKGQPDAILIVEFSSEEQETLTRSVERLKSDSVIKQRVIHIHEAWSESEQNVVWGVRKNALGVMLGIKGDFKPLPFIEDSCIPVEHLAEYVAKIKAICDRYNRRLALYAHASVGVIHLRPLLNLKQEEDLQILQSISEEAFDLVVGYKGSWSGEHGDGLVRSYKLKEFFGEQLYEALREVKKVFDPKGLMNPGKIIDPPPMTESLRIHPGYRTAIPKTYYRFESEGGFDHAVEMCTGVGQCRKTLTGIMCPSFIATGDEEHSTRGRANALRAIISGELGTADFSSDRLYEVMDLCIECKGCKTECPSGVDMAKMKAEFLAHYYEQKGLPLRKRIVGNTRSTAELASLVPGLSNLVMNSSLSRKLLEKWAGFDTRRSLPSFAKQTFNSWFKKRKSPSTDVRPDHRIVLFSDTFSNYYEPSVARSAVSVLEAMNFSVILGEAGCCGRPLISAGLLEKAKIQGAQVIKALDRICPESRILVLEPSCYSTFKDDYLDLLDDRESTKRVVDRIVSIEELMADPKLSLEEVSLLFAATDHSILLHGHCQQKALLGSKITAEMLGQIPGAVIEEIPEGCCGMAGSFGYEKEHYDLSRKIAERHLVPAVSAASDLTEIAVSGFSCRSQIKHLTGRKSYHPVEVLARHLK